MSRNAPPKKRLLITEPNSFHEIRQSRLRFHFQERFRATFALWHLPNERMFGIPSSETSQMNMPISGRRKIPASCEWALFVAEDSSTFKLITRSFQLEISLWRRKISILICLIKGLRNQIALFDLLTASSECRSFLLFLICRKLYH